VNRPIITIVLNKQNQEKYKNTTQDESFINMLEINRQPGTYKLNQFFFIFEKELRKTI
jgi:hypothetical protein